MRVHPEILERQKLPPALVTKKHLERALRGHPQLRALPAAATASSSGSSSCTSRGRSRRGGSWSGSRTPEKNWKFSAADAKERGHWKEYMAAYEDMIRRHRAPEAPWYVVPADNKWFTRIGGRRGRHGRAWPRWTCATRRSGRHSRRNSRRRSGCCWRRSRLRPAHAAETGPRWPIARDLLDGGRTDPHESTRPGCHGGLPCGGRVVRRQSCRRHPLRPAGGGCREEPARGDRVAPRVASSRWTMRLGRPSPRTRRATPCA